MKRRTIHIDAQAATRQTAPHQPKRQAAAAPATPPARTPKGRRHQVPARTTPKRSPPPPQGPPRKGGSKAAVASPHATIPARRSPRAEFRACFRLLYLCDLYTFPCRQAHSTVFLGRKPGVSGRPRTKISCLRIPNGLALVNAFRSPPTRSVDRSVLADRQPIAIPRTPCDVHHQPSTQCHALRSRPRAKKFFPRKLKSFNAKVRIQDELAPAAHFQRAMHDGGKPRSRRLRPQVLCASSGPVPRRIVTPSSTTLWPLR